MTAPLSGKRIVVLTTGHLATSPRMTRAADAFAEAGANVHVVSTRSTPWAVQGDADIVRRRPGKWDWRVIDYRRESRAIYMKSGARQKVALQVARRMHADRLPLYVAALARERVFPEVVAATRGLRPDFVYGGGAGLAATHFAARWLDVRFGVDLEDFHTGDQDDSPAGHLIESISGRIEKEILPQAALRTAGSKPIADEYARKYNLDFVTIDNAFGIVDGVRSAPNPDQPLRLYWFSQTIGPGRGLEDAIDALGISGIDVELHLQGARIEEYFKSLTDRARDKSPRTRIIHHAPCAPDDIVNECAKYDVGLALEILTNVNRDLCLTNKALAYVAAGMALIMTDTQGQRLLAGDLGDGAFLFKPGDVSSFAHQLSKWSSDRTSLQHAKDTTYDAAVRRWNWDDSAEKGLLVESVARAISGAPR